MPLPTSPNPAGQNVNSGYRKLALRLTDVTNATLAVLMVPLTPGQPTPTNFPPLVPLQDWVSAAAAIIPTPTNSPPTALPATYYTNAGASVDIDLRVLASDDETPISNLLFSVTGAVNGAVTLLADGHTADSVPRRTSAALPPFNTL